MEEHVDFIRKQISDRAQEFCLDNPRFLGCHLQIETAMLIGASIVFGTPFDLEDNRKLTDTPEGEELLRQLFEGEPPSGVEHSVETARPYLECCSNWGKCSLH